LHRTYQALRKVQHRLKKGDKKGDNERQYLQQKVKKQVQYVTYCVHVSSLPYAVCTYASINNMSRKNIIIAVIVVLVLGVAYYWYARAEMIRKIPPNAGFPLPEASTTVNVSN
jgi:hypothetical protein